MLSTPKTSHPEDRPSEDKKDVKDDPSAEFIQEMAESGSASDLSTINAAADAVEGKEDQAVRRHPSKAGRTSDDATDGAEAHEAETKGR